MINALYLTSKTKKLNILIIDNSEQDAIAIGELLSMVKAFDYKLFYASNFESSKLILDDNQIHLILMSLFLPDSNGAHTFTSFFQFFSHIPIVVLTDLEDRDVGKYLVLKGAQDFLMKSKINSEVLSKVVLYAIKRKNTEEKLRMSEERYHELFHRSNDAIYMTTKNGDFIDINSAGLKLFGYSENDINKITVSDLYINDEDRRKLTQKLEDEGEIFNYEVDLKKKDGKTVINCILNSTVIRNGNDEITGYQGFIKDISKRKKTEEALFKSLKKLDEANRELKSLNTTLEQKVNNRTKELFQEKEVVMGQNKEITESMNYAKRIQASILPSLSKIQEKLPDSFIYYSPKEIVSGDFYWFESARKKAFFAVVDCTGHGVPGAFMSIIGHTQLNEIISDEQFNQPHLILKELDKRVRHVLRQNDNVPHKNKDGMELGFMVIDFEKKIIEYSGAMRPLYYVKDGSLHIVKGDKFSIGGSSRHKKQFKTYKISFSKNDCFYLFSDGYPDQFGGEKGKKFKTQNVAEMIKSMAHLPMKNQFKIVQVALKEWMKNEQQIDDILFTGIKF